MKILNIGIDSAKHDTQEIHEALQLERSNLLTQVRTLQLAARLLVQAEGKRLAQKDPADSRVATLAAIDRTVQARIAVLDTEQEVAAIRVPPVAKTDALVHGRITDDADRAAGAVTVTLVRADGSAVAGVKPVTVDAAGYYAFVIDPQAAATITATDRLSVAVQRGDSMVVPKAAAGFTLATGTVAVKDVALTDTELRKLQLRSDFGFAAAPAAGPVTAAPRAAAKPAATKGTSKAAGKGKK